jgi:hypothetical protein
MENDTQHLTEGVIVEDSPSTKKVVSITEAARINNVTRQAIYVAIKQKKLKASKDTTRWTINLEDLENYRKLKYSRTKSMFDGELLFDTTKFYSINQAAKVVGVPAQKIYYATRVGLLKASRRSCRSFTLMTSRVTKRTISIRVKYQVGS